MSHLFAGRRWVFETTFTQEECVRRLKSKVRGMWETKWDPDRPLYGTVTSSGFAVQITPGWGRAVNLYFIRGVFTPSGAGTTIRAQYGLLTTVRLFVAGIASFFLFMWWRVFRLSSHAEPPGLTLFLNGTLFLCLLYAYWVLRRLKRRGEFDRDLILGAVAEIIEARISETPEAVS